MFQKLSQRPAGVLFNALSEAVFECLARHTAFPWPVMLAQSKRVGEDPANLTSAGLTKAMPHFVTAVERFTDPVKAASVHRELRALITP